MTFQFETEGFDELQERFERIDTMTRITFNDGLRRIGRVFVPAKGSGPLADETPRRTGKLARSSYFQILPDQDGFQKLEIRQPAKNAAGVYYGGFVREGTRPHDIYPVNAKALRFEVDGVVVFAKRVHHPGTKPNPYHIRVFEEKKPEVEAIASKMGRSLTAYLAGEGGQN